MRLGPAIFALSLALLGPGAAWATDAGAPATTAGTTGTTPSPTTFTAALAQTADTSRPIEAGGTVAVTYTITHPADATVTFPEVVVPERWVLIEAVRQPQAGGERAKQSVWVATFGIYRPGTTTLESFPIRVSTPQGGQVVLETEPVQVKVLSTLADAKDEPTFGAPRPPVPVWVDDYTLAYLGGGALALLLVGLAGWLVRRRQLMMPPPPPPPRAAHEIAIEKLSALAGDDLVERGEYMIYWVRLSEAVREYLGASYGFPGTELTSTEILRSLRPVKWPAGLDIDDIDHFLRRCDEVKFGGANPNVTESTETLRRAFTIVELTRPRPVETLAAAGVTKPATELGHDETEVDDEEPNDTVLDPASRWAPPEQHKQEDE